MQHINATLAFVFSVDFQRILLIRKEKPLKHAGLLNGLGGKCEANESHQDCLLREVEEEAGIRIPTEHWLPMGTLRWENWNVSIWTTVLTQSLDTFPDPAVAWFPLNPFPQGVLTNLKWLIPLALDIHQNKRNSQSFPQVQIDYTELPQYNRVE